MAQVPLFDLIFFLGGWVGRGVGGVGRFHEILFVLRMFSKPTQCGISQHTLLCPALLGSIQNGPNVVGAAGDI